MYLNERMEKKSLYPGIYDIPLEGHHVLRDLSVVCAALSEKVFQGPKVVVNRFG